MAYMTYLGIDSLNSTPPGEVNKWFTDLNSTLSSYGDPSSVFLVPQIGLSMPHNGGEEKIADGSYDNALAAFVAGMRALAPRPAFIRIGYEFNGPWNGYKPDSYIGAWKRIEQFVRNDSVTSKTLALVWDRTCDETNDAMDWYPGDDDVDWWGINIYSDHSAPGDTGCVEPFLKTAQSRGFPVMLGEVTPRGKNTSDASAWHEWFVPYFDTLLKGYPGIKFTSYINRAWNFNPAYKGWGDSRIQTAGANASNVAAQYVSRMSSSSSSPVKWLNTAGQTTVLAELGLSAAETA